MMVEAFDKCTGCGACVASCPKSCIKLLPNEEGFLYPCVDEALCISCNKCTRVCPAQNTKERSSEAHYFAGYSLNDEYRRNSSSGGIMSCIAEYVLRQGGVVFGCGYDNLHPVQMYIEGIKDIDKIRRSKYVQSNTNSSFIEAKSFLEQDRIVLYVGTPCIVAGLKSYLGKSYTNLITIDLLCHGVPSDELFQRHIKYLEDKYSDKLEDFQFRLKPNVKRGKCAYHSFYSFYSGKKKFLFSWHDPFFNEYLEKAIFRKSCYQCMYADSYRVGDITIGDYGWGFIHHPELKKELSNEPLGLSCIITNSKFGLEVLSNCNVRLVETKLEWISEKNETLLHPTQCDLKRREHFFTMINESSYADWATGYLHSTEHLHKTIRGIRNNLIGTVKICIKKIIKKD